MGFLRFKALKSKHATIKDIALGQDAWTVDATKAERSFNSQFEVPVLFYPAILTGIFLQLDSNLFLILSWAFVISRLLHSFIHSTSNYVPLRFRFFVAGALTLIAMWIVIAVKII